MKVLTSGEVEEKFGLSPDLVARMEDDAAHGVLHGEPRSEVVRGRPFMFGEEMRQVGFKEPIQVIDAIDRRASELGMIRSDYLRSLVEADLAMAEGASAERNGASSGQSVVKTLSGKRASDFWKRWERRALFSAARGDERASLASSNEGKGAEHARFA